MGSDGPGLGRNPSKGENFRGLWGKSRQSLHLLHLAPGQEGRRSHLPESTVVRSSAHWAAPPPTGSP